MAAARALTLLDNPVAPFPVGARRSRFNSHALAEAPTFSVVIVNYCQWKNTAALVQQLRSSFAADAGAAEFIVIDNHSPADPLLRQLRRADGVSLRRFGRNRGFARAVNEGCRFSRGEWVLLLNPDMSVSPGFLDEVTALTERLRRDDARAGAVGLGVRNSDGTAQPSSGPLPTLWRTMTGLLWARRHRRCTSREFAKPTEVEWATGCALLIRRDCWRDVGGFDEDFFLYYEDVDFCRRATDRGWRVSVDPTIRLTHHSPLHTRSVPAPLRQMTRHALLTYGLKHWPRWQTWLLGGIVGVEALARQAMAWWRGRLLDSRCHKQTRQLALDLLTGRRKAVRARVRATASQLESVAAAQDGCS